MNTMIWTVAATFDGFCLSAVVVCGSKDEPVDNDLIIKTAGFNGSDYEDHEVKLLGFTASVWEEPTLVVAESL